MVGGKVEPSYIIDLSSIDPDKYIIDVVTFDGSSNVQFGGNILKNYYPKLAVMRVVEHTAFFSLCCFKNTNCEPNYSI